MNHLPLPVGVIGVLQTPFHSDGTIDFHSSSRLIEDALASGIDGFLVPAIASENACLSFDEKILLAEKTQDIVGEQVPVIWVASAADPSITRRLIEQAMASHASACLVAAPLGLIRNRSELVGYFREVTNGMEIPLVIQDWEPNGPGLSIEDIRALRQSIPAFKAIKVETLPAGPKYTAILNEFGQDLHVSGGWAVQQYIEGLDRGVHAMIPECSMIRLYKRIDTLFRGGYRNAAQSLFRQLLPVLSFTNQELDTSIRFFKRLLVRKGIFASSCVRLPSGDFDRFSERISDELIELVLELEKQIGNN